MSKEKTITVGPGSVVIKSAFAASDISNGRPSTSYSVNLEAPDANGDTPDKKRRSFLSKRSVSGA
jgi:hypothetical protein